MEIPLPWEAAPASLTLSESEIQVWQTTLPQTEEEAAPFLTLLSADERTRANRFLVPHTRAAFAGARGALRLLLGAYLGADPAQLRFGYGPQGKPALEGGGLHFNLSHSGGLALCAFSLHLPLGIDVEQLRPQDTAAQLARRFFSAPEVAALEGMLPDRRAEAFFTCWTRKEAYLKARGEGLGLGLGSFAVSLGEPAAILRSDEGEGECRRWRLWSLRPRPGYVGALCAPASNWSLRCFYK
ncbi:MAG: 4'-phosphopantetheinyl transferase superfamily protein [Candidatus Handelsmanbacteria bacterium]|nr:4'-phosphopantetheinyl transferase superfamily protein [Candidatus Handelsmanbacteria bacterium]